MLKASRNIMTQVHHQGRPGPPFDPSNPRPIPCHRHEPPRCPDCLGRVDALPNGDPEASGTEITNHRPGWRTGPALIWNRAADGLQLLRGQLPARRHDPDRGSDVLLTMMTH